MKEDCVNTLLIGEWPNMNKSSEFIYNLYMAMSKTALAFDTNK